MGKFNCVMLLNVREILKPEGYLFNFQQSGTNTRILSALKKKLGGNNKNNEFNNERKSKRYKGDYHYPFHQNRLNPNDFVYEEDITSESLERLDKATINEFHQSSLDRQRIKNEIRYNKAKNNHITPEIGRV